ncbi:HNH endonuclease [Domibacillus robiginosus]|uniref:HNH endonuclease n=1 Tax=Domibacillus robiginosus TaxID=1071054 RepID=UPI00067D78BE|nr:HNH endonuclease [Domibacillus robiginosus]
MIGEVLAITKEFIEASKEIAEATSEISKNSEISTVKETPVTEIQTRRSDLEGKEHPETGVRYERKEVDLGNGEVVDGVFPEFESTFDAKLDELQYLDSDGRQFREATNQLKEAIDANPELAEKFTPEQLEQISRGRTPDGYVWHHSEQPGVLQLVDKEIHDRTPHTGGRAIWGGGQEFR